MDHEDEDGHRKFLFAYEEALGYAPGTQEKLDYPASDVLMYHLAKKSRVIVRPSGIEPKVKCYYEVVETVCEEEFVTAMTRAEQSLAELITVHQESIN